MKDCGRAASEEEGYGERDVSCSYDLSKACKLIDESGVWVTCSMGVMEEEIHGPSIEANGAGDFASFLEVIKGGLEGGDDGV